MLRTLLTRRWVILTLVLAALIPTFYRLGLWQYHRYQQANRINRMISHNLSAAALPVTSLTKPGGTVPSGETYRNVTAVGHYDAAHQFVIRQRTDAGGDKIGFHVITPLVTTSGEAVLVNRGWVPASNTNGSAYPSVPRTPKGKVTVTGRLRPDETYASTEIKRRVGLPPRQYMIINSGEQAKNLTEPVVAGYIELTATEPHLPAADQAQLLPGPDADTNSMAVVGRGVHLPYAVQWWLFAAAVPVAWWVLLRRDSQEEREDRERQGPESGEGGPSGEGAEEDASPAEPSGRDEEAAASPSGPAG